MTRAFSLVLICLLCAACSDAKTGPGTDTTTVPMDTGVTLDAPLPSDADKDAPNTDTSNPSDSEAPADTAKSKLMVRQRIPSWHLTPALR